MSKSKRDVVGTIGAIFALALADKIMNTANALFLGDGRHLDSDEDNTADEEGVSYSQPIETGVRFQGVKPKSMLRREGKVVYLPKRQS